MPMKTWRAREIDDLIEKVVGHCGEDMVLAQKTLETIRAGFTLPSTSIVPEGECREDLRQLLCAVAGLDPMHTLPDGNQITPPPPRISLLERLRRAIYKTSAAEQRGLLLQVDEAPIQLETVKGLAKSALTTEINRLELITRNNDHVGIRPWGSDEHQEVRAYVLSSRTRDLYERSSQSAFEFSKWSPAAFTVSALSSLGSLWLAYGFWNKRVDAVFAWTFAACAYTLSLLIVFYWNDARYQRFGKSDSIYAERSNRMDNALTLPWVLQTIASMFVSPYLALTKIPVPGINVVAFIGACISPAGSNSSIMKRWFYDPLKAYLHIINYSRNKNDLANLKKRNDLVLMLQKSIDIFTRMSNEERNEITLAFELMATPGTKTGIATARLSFLAEMVWQNRRQVSWYPKQSWFVRELLDFSVWSVAVFFGAWAGIYYRQTGATTMCGWESLYESKFNPDFNEKTWVCPPDFAATAGVIGGYGSFLANIWYYVAAIYLVVDYIKMWATEYRYYDRFFTVERLAFLALFVTIAIAPTVAAVQLATLYTDPLYNPYVSIPVLVLMNILSLYNFKDELLARWWSHNHRFVQMPGYTKNQANHVANRQLFNFKRLVTEMMRLLANSDIKIAADLHELVRFELDQQHNQVGDDELVVSDDELENGFGNSKPGLRSSYSAMQKPHTFSERHQLSIQRARSTLNFSQSRVLGNESPSRYINALQEFKQQMQRDQGRLNRAIDRQKLQSSNSVERERRGRATTWTTPSPHPDPSESPVRQMQGLAETKISLFAGKETVRVRAMSFSDKHEKSPSIFKSIRRQAVSPSDARWTRRTQLPDAERIAQVVHRGNDAKIQQLIHAGFIKRVDSHFELHPNRFEM